MKKLFLDDERDPVGEGWSVVRSVMAAIAWVEENGFPDFVSFDNDLGAGCLEGVYFARYLVEVDLHMHTMPQGFSWYAHTQNPVARDRINNLLTAYMAQR